MIKKGILFRQRGWKMNLWGVLLLISLLTGCSEENPPLNLAPKLALYEAEEVERTSAMLRGKVMLPNAQSLTDRYRFYYGTTPETEQVKEFPYTEEEVRCKLEGLTPGTTYYYCLEAGNQQYCKRSELLQFTTQPNVAPTMGATKVLGQGPTSILLQGEITSTGGDPVTVWGFGYAAPQEKEQIAYASINGDTKWQLRIGDLKRRTRYTLRPFAENKNGRTYGEPFVFETDDVLHLETAGTLEEIIGEKDQYLIQHLNINGPMNGTDFRFLRKMCGKDVQGRPTEGRLTSIDLTEVNIVEGGLSYNASEYTRLNVVSRGLFSHLSQLTQVKLPSTTVRIESNAFEQCEGLKELLIPQGTRSVQPSLRCTDLEQIKVTEGSSHYQSVEGVLYNANGEELVWFPEKLSCDELHFSPTLKSIGNYALQHANIRRLVLPASLQHIGSMAFYESKIEEAVLPDGLTYLSTGVFQECRHLKKVTLGKECKRLDDYCFDGCPLQQLHVRSNTPPVCTQQTFKGMESQIATCRVYVPKGNLMKYQNHYLWQQFTNIIEEDAVAAVE